MKSGECRLCRLHKPLIKKSHILPNFFYKQVADQDNRAYYVSLNDNLDGRKVFTGEFEGGILCADCDNRIFGLSEKYASEVLFGVKNPDTKLGSLKMQRNLHPDGKLVSTFVTGLNYERMKLFFLSILWRSSISSRPYFKQVTLGPYEEQIRHMLYTSNPGKQMDFPCLMSVIVGKHKTLAKQLNTAPTCFRQDKCISYQFQLGQIILMFFVSKNKAPSFLTEAVLNESGEMRLIHMPEKSASTHLTFLLGKEIYEHASSINLTHNL